jgi:hypothetical protein
MFKNLIAPVQSWLLLQGRCVGCGMPLVKARHEKIDDTREKVTCNCRRVYVFTPSDKKYRRAKVDEA